MVHLPKDQSVNHEANSPWFTSIVHQERTQVQQPALVQPLPPAMQYLAFWTTSSLAPQQQLALNASKMPLQFSLASFPTSATALRTSLTTWTPPSSAALLPPVSTTSEAEFLRNEPASIARGIALMKAQLPLRPANGTPESQQATIARGARLMVRANEAGLPQVARCMGDRVIAVLTAQSVAAEQSCNELCDEMEARLNACKILDKLLQIIRNSGETTDLKDNKEAKELMDAAKELGVKIEGYGWKDKEGREALMDNIKSVRGGYLNTNDIEHLKLKKGMSIYERCSMAITSVMSISRDIGKFIIQKMHG